MTEEVNQNARVGDSGDAEARELEERLARCERERDEYLNGWKRAKADLINFQREELTRAEAVVQFGTIELLGELLSILDSFDLALHADPTGSNRAEGLTVIRSQLEALLKLHGILPIAALGAQFNPSLHEAMGEVESEKPDGVIVEEVARGWKLHERVLRPAKVKVSRRPTTYNQRPTTP